ncbi:MAG TPA: MFS transporter [Thermoleophilaceae bacterium]
MRAVRLKLGKPFASLALPNYRRYFAGQVVSLSGNWMQTVGELWLVLSLTSNPLAVGVTTALQFTPMLLFGAWGGVIADRLDKRRLLVFTQAAMALPALALWLLAARGVVQPWMIFALVFARGSVNAIDNPARQAFLVELVSSSRLVNAVGLNSALVQVARVAGPALAGLTIATVGVATCFLINAASFAAMIVALRRMDPAQLHTDEPAPRKSGQLGSALRYVRATPGLLIPLALMAVIGTFSYNFQTLLPLLAKFTFDGRASTYAALTTSMGIGAVVGALAASTRREVGPKLLVASAVAFGGGLLLAAAAPSLDTEAVSLAITGAASVTFASSVNSSLQLRVRPSMRGRVMALYSVVLLGSTPIGGPLMGWISGSAGPRAGLLLGAAAAIAGGLAARAAFARMPDTNTGEHRVAAVTPGRARGDTPRARTADRSHRGSEAVALAGRRPSPQALLRSRTSRRGS